MSSLYNLKEDYKRVLELQAEGVDEEVIKDTLESIDDAIEDKADSYSYVIREKKGQNDTIDEEIKRLQALKRSNNNLIKLLQENLYEAMTSTGKTKFKTDLNSFWIQKNPMSIEIKYEDNIPEEFYVTERKLQRRDLINYVKNNEIDGVELTQSEGVRIR